MIENENYTEEYNEEYDGYEIDETKMYIENNPQLDEYEHPIAKIYKINTNDKFTIDLINENLGDLLNYTDINYGDEHNIKRYIEKSIKGFIIIQELKNKYSISGIILYRAGILP